MEKSMAKQGNMNLRQAKKAVRKGMTPDEAGVKGLGYGQDYDKLLKSRAYKRQRADEAGYKSIRKAKIAAKENEGFLPDSPVEMKSPMELRGADLNVPGEQMEYIDKSEGAPTKMKKSPYTMYGQEMSPAQMQGKSPLAKYGCSKRI